MNPIDFDILWNGFVQFLQHDWWILVLVMVFFIYVIKTM